MNAAAQKNMIQHTSAHACSDKWGWRMELSRLPLPLSHQLESISVLFLRCHDYRALPLLDVKVNSFGAKLYTLLCFPSGQHWKWNEGILSITDWLNIWWWMCYDITRCINSVQKVQQRHLPCCQAKHTSAGCLYKIFGIWNSFAWDPCRWLGKVT